MIGTTLSHYRIVEELGRGGMGIVYKAEDTKLDRTVAIKVLPSAALASKDDRERFYREAKSAAALNHPHIAQVYEIDEAVPSDAPHGTEPSPFIAMEFIDGQPLDEHVKDKPLKLPQAVALAVQIAQALEAAHDKNIVHRDIKSANVMLTAKGQAKVLDFGLAKTAHSTMLTRMGSTLGTVAYMSPEQARGEDVDHRTDLWALGVVLYEMVSGKNPFGGDYEQAVVYSIMNEAPEPLTAVRTGVPKQLEWIVEKCLAKSADDRYQSAKDLIVDLRKVDVASASGSRTTTISTASAAPAPPSSPSGTSRPWTWAAAALVLGIVLTAGLMTLTRPEPEAPQLTQVDLSLPSLSFIRFPAMSPTGEYLAIQGLNQDGQKGIFLRTMSTGELSYVRGSDNAGDREMGFSPDGSRLAYNASANEGLYVMDVPSGIPAPLTDFGRFAYWESNDTIVMTDDRAGGGDSYRVSLSDPEPVIIDVVDPKLGNRYSNVLKTNVPGTHKAFGHQLVRVQGGNQDVSAPANVYAFDSKSGEVTIIAQNAINPYYIAGGILAYQIGDDNGPMVVRRLNADRDGFMGPPVEVLGGEANWGDYAITPAGDLLYIGSVSLSVLSTKLWQVHLEDRTVVEVRDVFPSSGFIFDPVVSPNGRLLTAGHQSNSGPTNIHLIDLDGATGQQITFQESNFMPAFTHDGRFLVWTSAPDGASNPSLFRIPVDQSRGLERFMEGVAAATFSPDGNWMAYTRFNDGRGVLAIRDLRTDRESIVDSTSALPFSHDFSPDSNYLVYTASGVVTSQVNVVSTDGSELYALPNMRGEMAAFSEDGQNLYVESGRSLYRVPIRLDPAFGIRDTQELILSMPYSSGFDIVGNDMVYVASAAVQFAGGSENQSTLVWRQNWSSHLLDELEN